MDVYLDLLPNQPKNEQTRAEFHEMLRARFEAGLSNAVERIWELPPMMVSRPEGEYLALLVEARDLFLAGSFYACVAMCGIVGERLSKDILRVSLLVRRDSRTEVPPAKAFDQLERVEVNGLVRFLKETGLLSPDAAKAAADLGELRNQYAHARGSQPEKDALAAIKLLHKIVEDTVSVFKEFEVNDGKLVRRERT